MKLALTPSAVSHQLAKLEALVGRALFVRGARHDPDPGRRAIPGRGQRGAAPAGHGLGFAQESTVLALDCIARGDRVRVLPQDDDLPVAAHHLVFPRAHSRYARVRRFLDWLQQELGQPFEY